MPTHSKLIQEIIEDLLMKHHIEAQVDYQLIELEEKINEYKITFIYDVLLVELMPKESLNYIISEVNKIVKSQIGPNTYVLLEWR